MSAKSRESVTTQIDHLTLHHQVRLLDTPDKAEFRKLQQLKDVAGELMVRHRLCLVCSAASAAETLPVPLRALRPPTRSASAG